MRRRFFFASPNPKAQTIQEKSLILFRQIELLGLQFCSLQVMRNTKCISHGMHLNITSPVNLTRERRRTNTTNACTTWEHSWVKVALKWTVDLVNSLILRLSKHYGAMTRDITQSVLSPNGKGLCIEKAPVK